MNSNSPLDERINEIAASFTPREAQVAAFMAANPATVAVSSTAELGAYTSTSDATVVRTAKKLGYSNFRELRRSALAISGRDPSTVLDGQIGHMSGSSSGAKKVLSHTADLLRQFEANLDTDSWDRAITALSSAARVITYGSGTSGCLADYLSIWLKVTGVPSFSIKATGLALADNLLDLSDQDVVVIFATLRRFREIDVVIDQAAKAGATTILMTETLGITLRDRVDIVLATPPTTMGTTDGVAMGMIAACALRLSVAAHNQSKAVQAMERLNTIRAEIVGGKLDIDG